jgi:3'-5' exoribonuclease Rv2179c-like domain
MLFALDTEFMEDGCSIDLISVGVVAEDGREFYKQVVEADHSQSNTFVLHNVLPYLEQCISARSKRYHWAAMSQQKSWKCDAENCPWLFRAQIAAELKDFVGESPQFMGYYCAYDWVAVCQMFGTMMALPQDWPKYCREMRQWLDERYLHAVVQPDDMPHHALSDAQWIMHTYQAHS